MCHPGRRPHSFTMSFRPAQITSSRPKRWTASPSVAKWNANTCLRGADRPVSRYPSRPLYLPLLSLSQPQAEKVSPPIPHPKMCHPERRHSQLHRDCRSRRICGLLAAPNTFLSPQVHRLSTVRRLGPTERPQFYDNALVLDIRCAGRSPVCASPARRIQSLSRPLRKNTTFSTRLLL